MKPTPSIKATQVKAYCSGFVLFSIILFSWFSACKPKEPANPTPIEPIPKPTPLVVKIPAWVKTKLGELPVPSDNPMTVEGVELGRALFYEKKLSIDHSQSCASCHIQLNAFGDPRPFSEGVDGRFGNRNAMSIANLAWATQLFWDGRVKTLEAQAHDPVVNPIEMKSRWDTVVNRLQRLPPYVNLFYKAFGTKQIDSNLVVKAIAQFERSMISFESYYDKFAFEGNTNALIDQEKRGKDLFFGKAHCGSCHTEVLLTDNQLRNNGLDIVFKDKGLGEVTKSELDNGKFKVPSLRNVGLSAPYMHDSRFENLRQVIEHYNTGVKANSPNLDAKMQPFIGGLQLTEAEKEDLLAFLQSLTDNHYVTNPEYLTP